MAKQESSKQDKVQEQAKAPKAPRAPQPKARLAEFYRDTVVAELQQKLNLKNVMEVPRISKITVNMGVGEAVADKKIMDNAVGDLTKITGQKPLVTRARKSVATFKVRDGLAIGAKVTLRGARMYEFLDRLVNIAMPRIRDFRGVSARSFDGQGNYNFGVKEQIIFPEIAYDQIDAIRGMDITITTTARDDKSGRALLEAFNFPFRK
jgi:large subunit ribosomal protein L5